MKYFVEYLSPTCSQNITEWDTGLDPAVLKYVGMKSVQVPPADFAVHQHLFKHHVEVSWRFLGRTIELSISVEKN